MPLLQYTPSEATDKGVHKGNSFKDKSTKRIPARNWFYINELGRFRVVSKKCTASHCYYYESLIEVILSK